MMPIRIVGKTEAMGVSQPMNNESTDAVALPDTSAKPLLFISHKHADKPIADALKEFIRSRTGGRLRVFQSSSFFAEGPRVGRTLSREIRKAVAEAAVVILVYTSPDQDWNFCMWECGIASDPETPEAKIIVLQCGAEVPTLFTDQVHVKARDLLGIQKFANELLTDPEFLPGYPTALTDLVSQSQEIQKAATDLFGVLEPLLPDPDGDANWTAWPYLQFELDMPTAERIKKLLLDSKREEANELIRDRCSVVGEEKAGDQIFGVTEFKNLSVRGVADLWQGLHPKLPSNWVQSLVDQLTEAAGSRLPALGWTVLPDRSSAGWYAPVLVNWRRRMGCMQFDVHFVPFRVDPANAVITIEVPRASET